MDAVEKLKEREKKATKSDDTEVPEVLWWEALVERQSFGWSKEFCRSIHPKGRNSKVMNLLRERMLHWWKKRML